MKVMLSLSTAVQEKTPEFKEWFGTSKVINKTDGTPIKCYHGTCREVLYFEKGHNGKHDYGYLGEGFYFSPIQGISNTNAKQKDSEPHTVPMYMSVQNPYVINDDNYNDPEHGLLRIVSLSQKYQQEGMRFKEAYQKAARTYKHELLAAGYDGVIDATDEKLQQYVAFHPEQIKSAVHNNGNFDPDSPNIKK